MTTIIRKETIGHYAIEIAQTDSPALIVRLLRVWDEDRATIETERTYTDLKKANARFTSIKKMLTTIIG